MPSIKVHCAISRKRTGRSFEELHRWIDEFQSDLGSEHRARRHYWRKMDFTYIEKWWERKQKGLGRIAVEEWLFHIVIDNLATLNKVSKRNHPMQTKPNIFCFGFMDNGFIQYLQGDLGDTKMNEIFENLDEVVSIEYEELKADLEDLFA